ncbi:hypothetical protein SAMN05660776_0918 [Salegentibacter holothuriorum]|uniref:PD-(D/E)XK nuclease superfamily protein n=1 Tax=Salegentibacter holothuriorum TaxID=241145 RepID=A0A1T5AW34_9FLAO|nr:hypothetical protein [Salegentibacter holothuriorum]SKB39208.1 hypothetical protein SAMN05660776_0918 [Salegentibacter holothuriorum]
MESYKRLIAEAKEHMEFTGAQIAVLDYLLETLKFEQLDFEEKNFTYNFIYHLRQSAPKYKRIASCRKKEICHDNEKKYIPENGLISIPYKENENEFEALTLSIDNFLRLEINLKRKKLYERVDNFNENVSATDISSFTFCPANYSISRSLKYKILESSNSGLELHEKSPIQKLLKKRPKTTLSKSYESELENEESYQNLQSLIHNCEILYSGHSINQKKVFKSKNGKFVGQPDYILYDKHEQKVFVVEEKYHHIPKEFLSYGDDPYYDALEERNRIQRNRQFFHDNHMNQVLSYIFGIKEYKIEFGVLIYWKYEFQDSGKKEITKCDFKIIKPDKKEKEKLNHLYLQIKAFKEKGEIVFDPSIRNPKKCANCVNNYLCGHKTGKFKTLTFPYKEDYLNLNSVDFPKKIKSVKDDRSYEERFLERLEEVKKKLDEDSLTI